MRSRRSALVAGLGMLCAPVVVASLAWACTPSKNVRITSPKVDPPAESVVVPPGGTVGLQGIQWEPGPIEVRWQTRTGARLPVSGAAYGPSFDIKVTVPDRLTPGVRYQLVVVGPDSPGANGTSPTENVMEGAPLQFTAGERVDQGADPAPVDPTPAPAPGPAPAQAPTAAPSATPGPTGGPAAAAPVNDETSVFEPTDAPAGATGAAPARSPGVASVPGRNGSAARTGSAALAAPAAPGDSDATSQPANAEVAPVAPSSRAVGSDLWSGFAAGPDQRGASLVDNGSPGASNGSMGTGLAVLGIGLVALLAALGYGLRRRSVKVVSRD